jgi:uncharacterized RDD family membrane protein YckC
MTSEPRRRVSPIPHDARPFQGLPAGVVTRLLAAVLDGVVVGLALAAGYFGFAGLRFLVDPRGFSLPRPGLFFSLGAGFAVTFVYLTVSWALSGRSYGDLVMGLRVRRRSGRSLRLPGAAARAALCVLLPIGIVWVPVGRDNRSLQDLVLGTEVIYDWRPRAAHHQPEDAR